MKWPYSHLPLSLLISVASLGAALLINLPLWALAAFVGPVFYGVREVIQWRQKGWWDKQGFVWGSVYPLGPLLLVLILITI